MYFSNRTENLLIFKSNIRNIFTLVEEENELMGYRTKAKVFSVIAVIMMVFSLFVPAISAQSTSNAPKVKLSDSLLQEFTKQDEVTFIVTFKEKPNTAKAAQEALKKAKKANLSAEKTEISQRKAVISELKTTANKTQKNVVAYLKDHAITDYESYHITNAIVVTATEDVAKEIAKFKEVSMVIPNHKIKAVDPVVKANDAKLSSGVLKNVGMLNTIPLWEEGITGEGIVIGSLDSGAQWDHPAIKNNYRGYNPANGTVNHKGNFYDPISGIEEAYDDDGHGTHTIGTMVGYIPEGTDVPIPELEDVFIGVAPKAKWISAKILDAAGEGTTDDLLAAAQWMLAPGGDPTKAPDVVNNSWGFPGLDPIEDLDEFFRDVINHWRDAGIFPVFAAGNEVPGVVEPIEGSVSAPAAYPEAFAVGAVDMDEKLADFSLRGPSPYGETKPEVVAAGVGIISAYPGNSYAQSNGTSMAAPAVAGVVALLLQAYPDATIKAMEDALTSTAKTLTNDEYPKSPNNGFGHGLVNAAAAAEALAEEPKDPEEPKPIEVERIFGNLRYDTAIEISQKGWKDGELKDGLVVLARGDNFADALAGVPLAYALGSPILLTPSEINSPATENVFKKTLAEIDRLGAENILILGGDVAISTKVDNQLSNEGLNTKRLEGDTRFDTAAVIAKWLVENVEGFSADKVAVANGMDFPDALSIASSAAQKGMPILLTKEKILPEVTAEVLEDLGVKSSYAIGGEKVIGKAVYDQLPSAKRLAGQDRYDTNAAIVEEFNINLDKLYIATGDKYVDALTGAVLAAKNNSSVVLVNEVKMKKEEFKSYIKSLRSSVVTIFGGNQAISEAIADQLKTLLNN